MSKVEGLTDKQEKFCYEYMKDLCATEAAKRAGYSERNAGRIGYSLLERDRVKKKIYELKKEMRDVTKVSVKKTVEELGKIGYANIKDVLEIRDGKLYVKDFEKLPREFTAAIKSVKETKYGIRIHLYDKTKALELIGKHLAMFTEKHEITGKDGEPIEFTTLAKKAKEWVEKDGKE